MKDNKDFLRYVLTQYRRGLESTFKGQLKDVLLFGSWARGEGQPRESDIDVLCIMRQAFDYAHALDAISDLAARLSLEHDVVISTVFTTDEDFKNSPLPFFKRVREESISV